MQKAPHMRPIQTELNHMSAQDLAHLMDSTNGPKRDPHTYSALTGVQMNHQLRLARNTKQDLHRGITIKNPQDTHDAKYITI